MKFVWLLCWLSARIALSQAASHWMVTETGLLKPRDDSPFLMANPFDLLSFLNQDTRWENILNMYNNLIRRQKNINKLWIKLEYDSSFDRHIASNEFCQKVGNIDLIDWYTSFLEDGRFKGVPEKEFSLQRVVSGDTDVPDCKKISSLTFSMFAFEHLDSMINREHLNATPELTLPELFTPIMTADQFGHWISDVLRKNSTSWLHYNLAAIFWRVKGNVPKALECSRRALHYAPRQYRNIALLCLGTILHRSRHSDDAAVVLGAAVDHDPRFPISHFAVGGALAVSGDFNSSLKHLDLSIKLHRKFELAEKFRNAVRCHLDMFKKMQAARSTLKQLSKAISDYIDTENQWLKFQTSFLKTMKHKEEYDYKNVENNMVKMGELTGLKIKELKKEGDRNSIVQYFIDSPTYNAEWIRETGVTALDTAHSLQRIIRHIGKHAGLPTKKTFSIDERRNTSEILKEIGPTPNFPDIFLDPKNYKPHINIRAELKVEHTKSIDLTPAVIEIGSLKPKPTPNEQGKVLYPPTSQLNRNRELFDTDPAWPCDILCKEQSPRYPDNLEAIYPVFMPFENKGIKLNNLLTERIGVPAMVEHELPWHPPTCPTDKDLPLYTQRKGLKMQLASQKIYDDILRKELLKFLSDSNLEILKHMQDAEIGQRIQTAIEKKLASKWILYTIASLYWRVRGNFNYALNCLLAASRVADTRYRDVVLASLASVCLEMGLLDESAVHAEEAHLMNQYEPATNFVIAQHHMIKKNQEGQFYHLKQVLRADSRYLGGIARQVLNTWSCIQKQVEAMKELGSAGIDAHEICAEVEPGVSMVCDRDGTNCHITNRHCYAPGQKRESSQIVRMLELKDGKIQGAPVDHITDVVFDKFLDEMPTDRTDMVAHQKNYDAMMKVVNRMLKGCGARGCNRPEDTSLKFSDCDGQQLHMDYWLHIISFRQQLSDTDMKLPADVAAISVYVMKTPECHVPADWTEDFFLSRMLRVNTTGWQPVLSLMHQFADLFDFFDYTSLGTKIAKYIDANPTSWEGLLAAGWWCGASGRGLCASRCLAAALAASPPRYKYHSLRPLAAMLLMQGKKNDGKDISYLTFYASPRSKIDSFLVAVSHAYREEFEPAIWMFRYALRFDDDFLPVKACLHISMCFLLFGDKLKLKANEIPNNVK